MGARRVGLFWKLSAAIQLEHLSERSSLPALQAGAPESPAPASDEMFVDARNTTASDHRAAPLPPFWWHARMRTSQLECRSTIPKWVTQTGLLSLLSRTTTNRVPSGKSLVAATAASNDKRPRVKLPVGYCSGENSYFSAHASASNCAS